MDHGSRLVAERTRYERLAMNAERYAQVRRLFLAACELAESERGMFLDQACMGDPELRQELESLLKQPRSTTIIGTSSEEAADGKILSPVAHLREELTAADIPVEAAKPEGIAGKKRRYVRSKREIASWPLPQRPQVKERRMPEADKQ